MELLEQHRLRALAVFRIVVAFLFASHGASSLFGIFTAPHNGSGPSFGEWPGWWAAAIQLVGGVLVMLGVGTRGAAMVCSGSMAFAYFTKHQPHELLPIQNGGEAAVMFCWSFLLIMFSGPGSWALSSVLVRSRSAPVPVLDRG